jgi:hypothetical protein
VRICVTAFFAIVNSLGAKEIAPAHPVLRLMLQGMNIRMETR